MQFCSKIQTWWSLLWGGNFQLKHKIQSTSIRKPELVICFDHNGCHDTACLPFNYWARLWSPSDPHYFAYDCNRNSCNGDNVVNTISQCNILLFSLQMAGKFLLGPITDRIGGENTMILSMFSLSVILGLCSLCRSIHAFSILWITLSFIYAASWGAVGKIVRENFPMSNWAQQLGFVAAGSRIGHIFSSLLNGKILQAAASKGTGSWRFVFRVAVLLQVIILGLFVKSNSITNESGAVVSSRRCYYYC